jgi:hypothetical protein
LDDGAEDDEAATDCRTHSATEHIGNVWRKEEDREASEAWKCTQ